MCGAWEEGFSESLLSSFSCLDNAMECDVHGCDVLNKRGFVFTLHAIGAHPNYHPVPSAV